MSHVEGAGVNVACVCVEAGIGAEWIIQIYVHMYVCNIVQVKFYFSVKLIQSLNSCFQ